MKLDYFDPEDVLHFEKIMRQVSPSVAAKAFNEICLMLGGRWPDARLEQEAPYAYDFFMTLMGHVPSENKRHDIDPKVVAEQIEKTLADEEVRLKTRLEQAAATLVKYEYAKIEGKTHLWSRPPPSLTDIVESYTRECERQKTHYAKVRVIELPRHGKKRFVLVYGDVNDAEVISGTGPFSSFEEAVKWFTNGGR